MKGMTCTSCVDGILVLLLEMSYPNTLKLQHRVASSPFSVRDCHIFQNDVTQSRLWVQHCFVNSETVNIRVLSANSASDQNSMILFLGLAWIILRLFPGLTWRLKWEYFQIRESSSQIHFRNLTLMMCVTAQVPLFNAAEIMWTCSIPLDADPTPWRTGLLLGPECVNVNPQVKVRLTKFEACYPIWTVSWSLIVLIKINGKTVQLELWLKISLLASPSYLLFDACTGALDFIFLFVGYLHVKLSSFCIMTSVHKVWFPGLP